jgi:hypothetical protein
MPLTSGLIQTELVDKDGFVTQPWQVYFRDQVAFLATVPTREKIVQIPPASAAVPVTPIGTEPLPSGLYRVTATVRVLTPASSTSSVAVTLHWVDGDTDAGVVCSLLLVAPVTGNTPASVGTGTALIRSGAGQPISYSTAYASVGAGMVYALDLVLERMGGE